MAFPDPTERAGPDAGLTRLRAADAAIGVMQLTDSLVPGGSERVAVNLANALAGARYRSHLGTTRSEGALASLVTGSVGRLRLERRLTIDFGAVRHLKRYIRENRIQILHAHGTAVFMAVAASFGAMRPAIIWHDHFGEALADRPGPTWLYRLAARRFEGVIAVSRSLADWSTTRLGLPADRVRYLPNFVFEGKISSIHPDLPGEQGARVVCVANLRPQKDHPNLLSAMRLVVAQVPRAHLLLVGTAENAEYLDAVRREMSTGELKGRVTWLGERQDVAEILRDCDVGVLASRSEGLPLALIEYGLAGLASVATAVGECAEVLDGGKAGLIVPPGRPDTFAAAIVSLLGSPGLRATLGEAFGRRVRETYGQDAALSQIAELYQGAVRRDGLGDFR